MTRQEMLQVAIRNEKVTEEYKKNRQEYVHEWYEKNKEKNKERYKKYREENKERINKYLREYRIRKPEKYHIHLRLIHRFLKWACCIRCGSTKGLCFHHIDPRTKIFAVSKTHKPFEIIEEIKKCAILCKACHCKEHNPRKGKRLGG